MATKIEDGIELNAVNKQVAFHVYADLCEGLVIDKVFKLIINN